MKRILIHSLIFSPDGVSTAYLYNDIALRLKESGFDIIVLTTTPHFNTVSDQLLEQPLKWKIWGICKVSYYKGIKVYHVPQIKFKRTIFRILGFVYWHIISFVLGLCIAKVDLILSPSPPLTIGFMNLGLAYLKKCKVIYNVQEIYPDILKMKEGFLLRFFKWMEREVYNKSDAVTTIDQVFYNTIVNRFIDENKLHLIPNFVDTDVYHPCEWKGVLNEQAFVDNNNVHLLYAGNIGLAQDWDPLIALAEKSKDMPIEFIIVGEGVKKKYLLNEINKRGISNIKVLPYQPRHLMPYILSYSDINFIFMNPNMEKDGLPSKIYTIMSCGKPLLVMSSSDTPIARFLSNKKCAKVITESDFDKKISEAYEWLRTSNKEMLRLMGFMGLKLIYESYTKEIVTRMYVDLVNDIIGE